MKRADFPFLKPGIPPMTSKRIPPDAFDFYVGLGPERSYQLVADHYSVSKRAVTKLAVREDWAQRLSKIEIEARERSDSKLVETVEEMRSRHLKMVKAITDTEWRSLPHHSGRQVRHYLRAQASYESIPGPAEATERAELPVNSNAARPFGECGFPSSNLEPLRNSDQEPELHLGLESGRVPYSLAGLVRQGAPLRICNGATRTQSAPTNYCTCGLIGEE